MSHFTHACETCGHDRERHDQFAHVMPTCGLTTRFGCACREFVAGPSTRRDTFSYRFDATDARPAAGRVEPLQEPGSLRRYQRWGPDVELCACRACVDAYAGATA